MSFHTTARADTIIARSRRRPLIFIVSAVLALSSGLSQASAAPQTTYQFKRATTPLEGPNARTNALGLIAGLNFPCRAVTAPAFIKRKGEVKVFKAQCDTRKWYVLLQSPEGQIKAFEWSGVGEPH